MQTRLTLPLDEMWIRRAKARARPLGKPLSRMVADYFAPLTEEAGRQGGSPELPPVTRSLRGPCAAVASIRTTISATWTRDTVESAL